MAAHEQLVPSCMSCILERIVPHPKGFVYLFTGNSGSFPPQPLGRSFVVRANFVREIEKFIMWAKKKQKRLTKK